MDDENGKYQKETGRNVVVIEEKCDGKLKREMKEDFLRMAEEVRNLRTE